MIGKIRIVIYLLLFLMAFFLPMASSHAKAAASTKRQDVRLDGKQNAKDLKLNINNPSMVLNTDFRLKVFNVEKTDVVQFQSTDENIVSIMETKKRNAILHANSIGSTTVNVTIRRDGRQIAVLNCKVTVRPPAVSIKFRYKKVILKVGSSKKVKVVIKPNISKEIPKYSSSNESVATVSSNGKVTLLAPGKAKITATISNGKSASYTVMNKR